MLYNLGSSGKTIYLSVNQFMEMTDEDFKQAQAYDLGFFCTHAFTDSALIELVNDDVEEEEEEVWENEDDNDRSLFSFGDIEELMQSEAQD